MVRKRKPEPVNVQPRLFHVARISLRPSAEPVTWTATKRHWEGVTTPPATMRIIVGASGSNAYEAAKQVVLAGSGDVINNDVAIAALSCPVKGRRSFVR